MGAGTWSNHGTRAQRHRGRGGRGLRAGLAVRCIAGSALDPAGAGSGPARVSLAGRGAPAGLGPASSPGPLSCPHWNVMTGVGGTGPSVRVGAPGVPRRRQTPRHGGAREQRVRPLAGCPGCGCVSHGGPAHRSLACSSGSGWTTGEPLMQFGCEPRRPSHVSSHWRGKNCLCCALSAPLNLRNVSDVIINKNFPSLDATAQVHPPPGAAIAAL